MSLHLPHRERAVAWLAQDQDPVTKKELQDLLAAVDKNDEAAIKDLMERFEGMLEFGTAGLRGILGAGPQRMNRVLVRRVAMGLGMYLLANVKEAKRLGVLIGRDARRNSKEFSEDSARVLGGLGIKVFLAHRPWPTPTTAWAVVEKKACAGVMVTASHNPPAYNGYKVYWSNGAQIVPPHDTGIAAAIDKVDHPTPDQLPELDDLRRDGLLIDLDESLHDDYLDKVIALRAQKLDGQENDLTIAYTPLHGVGALSVEGALKKGGFPKFFTEKSQREPDPEFPTVAFPNPEEKGAMDKVLALATEKKADLVLANDPDADRLCVALPTADGTYAPLTGDQVGVLLADYLLTVGPADKRMVATTIVSSQLLSFLAKEEKADYRETLTGFKWIGNAAIDYEREHHGRFVVGYEEALGYSVGPLVRDKDGVSAALIFAELTAWNRARGKTVRDHLDDIYRKVGLFVTEQVSLTKPGAEGMIQIKAAMAKFRGDPPKQLGGHVIEEVVDLSKSDGKFPPSDVLVFKLAGGRRVIMRPSGTEPKLKSYYEVRIPVKGNEPIADARKRGLEDLGKLRDAHQALLK